MAASREMPIGLAPSLALTLVAGPQDAPASRPAPQVFAPAQSPAPTQGPPELDFDFRYRDESGDGHTDRVTIWGARARGAFSFSPEWRVGIAEAFVVYSNTDHDREDFVASGDATYTPSDGERWRFRLDLHSVMEASQAWTGDVALAKRLSEEITLVLEAQREVVDDSMLSSAGENVNGRAAGQVRANLFTVGLDARPVERVDAYGRLQGGFYDGLQVQDNASYAFDYGVGVELLEGAPSLRLGYASTIAGYRRDLSGFFVQPPPPGVGPGGYFSPKFYTHDEIRLDFAAPLAEPTWLRAGAGAGYEWIDDVSHGSDFTRATVNASVRIEHRLSDRVRGVASYAYDNAGAANDEQRFLIGLRIEF